MSRELKTGIVAVIVIALFIWGYNFLKGQNLFDTNTRYFKVEYSNIAGLSEASLVTINGLKVGKVTNIEFNKSADKKGDLIVSFLIEKDFQFSKNSVVKIYSPSPLGGSNLAIVPNYKGEEAVSGDVLQGEVESSLFTSIGERLDPIQSKLEKVMVSADSLFKNVNNILDINTQNSLKTSVKSLETTLVEVKKTMLSINGILDTSSLDLKESIKNTKIITENFSKVSDTLVNANIGKLMKDADVTLTSVNLMLSNIQKEMKLNPKRFVHFSLFGKKAKPYTPNNTQELKEVPNK